MTVSVIVAFRDSEDGHRGRLWSYVRGLYDRWLPDLELVVGTDDGVDPFHKTLALNRAIADARGDLLLITDTDTWVPQAQIRDVIAAIEDRPYRPWNLKLKLGWEDTEELLAGVGDWDGKLGPDAGRRLENRNTYWAAPPILCRREHVEAVGGFDEGFRGWGQEDEAFALSLRAIYGNAKYLRGPAIHLWHPRIGRSGDDEWPGQERHMPNVHRVSPYRRNMRRPDEIRRLVRERGGQQHGEE